VRSEIPSALFEGAPIIDWVTCSDDELIDLVMSSKMRFIKICGDDGDTIKISSDKFDTLDHTIWADIAIARDNAAAIFATLWPS
jgi:hypothetical protein